MAELTERNVKVSSTEKVEQPIRKQCRQLANDNSNYGPCYDAML